MERVNGEIVISHQLSEDLVQVTVGTTVVGFVESAGPVFVALHGPRYDRAVEVSQSLAFDVAAAGLLEHVRVVAALNTALDRPAKATEVATPDATAPAATSRSRVA